MSVPITADSPERIVTDNVLADRLKEAILQLLYFSHRLHHHLKEISQMEETGYDPRFVDKNAISLTLALRQLGLLNSQLMATPTVLEAMFEAVTAYDQAKLQQ